MNPVHFSSTTDEWSTPPDFFAKVEAEFGPFDLDPCATAENAKAPKFYTREEDGLTKDWFGNVWINPPYMCGKLGTWAWVRRAAREMMPTKRLMRAVERRWLYDYSEPLFADLVVMLLPARTDVAAWHDFVIPYAAEVRFIRGRLKFGGAKNSAPFPSALVIFRRKSEPSKGQT